MDTHRYYEISGLGCFPSNPLAKLVWMRRYDPDFYKAARYATFQEYFLRRFGAGSFVMDEMSCERIGLGSPESHDFNDELLAWEPQCMPVSGQEYLLMQVMLQQGA